MTAPRPWSYSFFPCDCSPDSLGPFMPLVALWQSRARARPLPCWSDFEITDFAGWHDMMTVDAVSHDPLDGLTLIWGSRLAEVFGYQARGTSWRGSATLRGLIAEDFAFLERVCGEPCIGLARGRLDWRERDHVAIESLQLPFAPADAPVDRTAAFRRIVPPTG